MILEVIDTVVQMGGTQDAATKRLGLAKRTVERWRGSPDDMRHGPKSEPANKLSEDEREEMRVIANSACSGPT